MRLVGEERRRAIAEEVNRLLAAGFIMEIKHPKWLANPVLVPKKNKTWWMCIDYTSINRACPKDPFVLPHRRFAYRASRHGWNADGIRKVQIGQTWLLSQSYTRVSLEFRKS
jgi:hypothetical protein